MLGRPFPPGRAPRAGRPGYSFRLTGRRAGVGGWAAALRQSLPGPIASRAPRRCLVSSSRPSPAPAELPGGDAQSAARPRPGPLACEARGCRDLRGAAPPCPVRSPPPGGVARRVRLKVICAVPQSGDGWCRPPELAEVSRSSRHSRLSAFSAVRRARLCHRQTFP